MSDKVYSDDDLNLEVQQRSAQVSVVWTGRSTARDPMGFIGPVLTEARRIAIASGVKLVLDFRALAYMNSSTITSVIRLLREASKSADHVLVIYQRAARWQELSFSALTIFETDDKRIEIRGA